MPRIARLARGKRFRERVFTADEIAYCRAKRNAAQHYAVRFAAKEAVYKALGMDGVAHRDISVFNDARGKPSVRLAGRFKKFEGRLALSLSHTADYAVASAVFHP